jgi:hypothetical protein
MLFTKLQPLSPGRETCHGRHSTVGGEAARFMPGFLDERNVDPVENKTDMS